MWGSWYLARVIVVDWMVTRPDQAAMDEALSVPSADGGNLVDEIIQIVESAKAIRDFRQTQRKECITLVRRMTLFLPFLEEISCYDATAIPRSAASCLMKLKKAFESAMKFLKLCHCGSKIFLVDNSRALEGEAMMVQCHGVYEKICQALDGMPYEELGVSEEEREQLELLHKQLQKAKRRTDTQDIELIMDFMVVLSKTNDRNVDVASIERLANKLHLHTPEELRQETLAVQKLVNGRKGQSTERTEQIISLLNKFKRLAGVPQDEILGIQDTPKSLSKCPPIAVPNDFLCPITLEIMIDPVIVATGQSYDRESIQKWLDSNHRTCPKTQQVLEHLSLTPNFALKNLIVQWCEENNFQLPKKAPIRASVTAENPSTLDDIQPLVQWLSSGELTKQRQAVQMIRLLSKESPENRTLIAKAGGLPPIVQLLSYPDSLIQEHAVTAILNLSIDETNKRLISKLDVLPVIIKILQQGTTEAKENSAAALFSLSMLNENKTKIGLLNGIDPLINLLRTGTIRGKKDAMTALFNLCLNPYNKEQAIQAGIVAPLLKVLDDPNLDMVNEALSTLLILASSPKGREELGQLSFIQTLVNLIRCGTPKNQECATAVLLELGLSNSYLILAALQLGVYEYLVEMNRNGTERGQRKANSLLKLMSQAEQIP